MALSLGINVTQSSNRENFVFTETTGEYSASNTGGWGAPNPAYTDALTAVLSISKRNTDGTWETATDVDVYDDLPNIDGTEVSVSGEDAGFPTEIEDGIYKVVYTVTGEYSSTPFSASVTKIFMIKGGIKCCYMEKAAEYVNCNCGCDKVSKELDMIATEYRMLCSTFDCGNLDQAQMFITRLTKMCNNCGCN